MYNAHGKSDMRDLLAQYSPLVKRPSPVFVRPE